MLRHRYLVVVVALTSCMGAGVNTAPVPELAQGDVETRGTEARALSVADESEIIANVVRGFYRPIGSQARLIDPRPLAHDRDPRADRTMMADINRAEALVRVIGLQRVCVLDSNAPECFDRNGGILRFSPAYSLGGDRDSAVIFAEYRPIGAGVPGEIEFRMVRRPQGWQMMSRRSLVPSRVSPARLASERLLETDRAFGIASGGTDLITAFSAMFDDSVIVQTPGGFADGKSNAVAALRANPDNERSRTTWAPIRVGVSMDGLHGFSYGYMTLTRPDGARVPFKYLAYWVNRGGEWRVLAYKRRPRPAGDVSMDMLAPALPSGAVSQPIAHSLSTIASAEKEFSDTAQAIGIGPAFEKYGRPDGMNMGGPTDTAFVIGNKAVGRSVGAGYPATGSPVHWAADHKAIAASSGDLGVTFGFIRPHTAPPPGQPAAFPFFTIWKRDPGGPWRYIAE